MVCLNDLPKREREREGERARAYKLQTSRSYVGVYRCRVQSLGCRILRASGRAQASASSQAEGITCDESLVHKPLTVAMAMIAHVFVPLQRREPPFLDPSWWKSSSVSIWSSDRSAMEGSTCCAGA